jgi:hypothetical protein
MSCNLNTSLNDCKWEVAVAKFENLDGIPIGDEDDYCAGKSDAFHGRLVPVWNGAGFRGCPS